MVNPVKCLLIVNKACIDILIYLTESFTDRGVSLVDINGLPVKEIYDMFLTVCVKGNLLLTLCIHCIEINVCFYRFTKKNYLNV